MDFGASRRDHGLRDHGLLAALLAVIATACTTSHRVALASERALLAGSDAWDAHTDAVIADCRAQALPTPEEREACVGEVMAVDRDVVAPAIISARLALQGYWTAVAAKAKPSELAGYLADFAVAVTDLPTEYFGGLQKAKR